MSRRFLTALRLVRLSSPPAEAQTGDLYFDETLLKVRAYTGTSWIDMPGGQTDALGPLNIVAAETNPAHSELALFNITNLVTDSNPAQSEAMKLTTAFPAEINALQSEAAVAMTTSFIQGATTAASTSNSTQWTNPTNAQGLRNDTLSSLVDSATSTPSATLTLDPYPNPDAFLSETGGTGTPTHRSATSNAVAVASSIVITRPAGVVNGDLLLTAFHLRGSEDIATLTGWTPVPNGASNSGSANADSRMEIFYKIASNEPASWTWSTVSGDMRCQGACHAIQNVDQANPINASNSQASATASTSVVAPSITPTVANTLLVGFFGTRASSPASFTPPPSMTERTDVTESGGAISGADEAYASTSATGTRTATASGSDRWSAALIAVKGAPASGGWAITQVRVFWYIRGTNFSALTGARLHLEWSIDGTAWNSLTGGGISANFDNLSAANRRVDDITAARTWTWTDLNNFRTRLRYVPTIATETATIDVDAVELAVTATQSF